MKMPQKRPNTRSPEKVRGGLQAPQRKVKLGESRRTAVKVADLECADDTALLSSTIPKTEVSYWSRERERLSEVI